MNLPDKNIHCTCLTVPVGKATLCLHLGLNRRLSARLTETNKPLGNAKARRTRLKVDNAEVIGNRRNGGAATDALDAWLPDTRGATGDARPAGVAVSIGGQELNTAEGALRGDDRDAKVTEKGDTTVRSECHDRRGDVGRGELTLCRT